MNSTLIVCGLTEWEMEMMKDKGKCRACIYNDSFYNREGLTRFCSKRNERLEKEEIIKEQETIINQLDQKIKDKNEYQRVLEAKIRRLKDRIKVLEK